jgi:hypothetical protein
MVGDAGTALLHADAEEMKRLQYTQPETFSNKIHDALWQDLLQIRFRVKMEEYQGVQRAKAQVIQATPARYGDCAKKSLAELEKLYQHCNPEAQAAVKELLSDWKNSKFSPVKGKAVFSSDWEGEMSRLLAATC